MLKKNILPLLFSVYAVTNAHGITLNDAIDKAVSFSPDYQAQVRDYEKTLHLRTVSNGALMPSVAINASSTYKNDKRDRSPNQKYTRNTTGLVVNQTLYKGGAIWYARSQSEIKIEQSRTQLQSQKQGLMIKVTKAYVDVLVARKTLELRKSALKSAKNNLDISTENNQSGITTSEELLNAQSRYASANANAIAAQGQVDIAENAYFSIVGEQAGDTMENLDVLIKDNKLDYKNVDDLIKQGANQNPDLKVAHLGVEIAKYQVKIKRADLYPSVTMEYRNTRTRDDYRNASTRNNTNESIGIMTRIPLYQQGVVRARLEQARLDERKAVNNLESMRMMNKRDIKKYWLDMTVTEKTVKAYQLAWLSLEKQLTSVRTEFEAGSQSLSAVNALESDVDKAKISYLNALRDHFMATYRLRASIGDLVPALATTE